ncbi:MAG: hypothetical protein AAGA62_14095, partial [Bacteroidota bacterium]
WLACPLHNRREDVRKLFRLRLKAKNEPLEPPAEYKAVYGNDELFNPARYRQLEHQLLKRLEAFVAWDHYQRDTFAADFHLLQSFRARGLDAHRTTRLRRYRPNETAGPNRLFFEYFHATEQYDLDLAANRGGRVDYLTTEYTLERYLLAMRLRQACTTLAHQRLHKKGDTYEIPHLEEILVQAGVKAYADDPFIHLYYLVALLQRAIPGKAEPTFERLITGLKQEGYRLKQEDQRNLLLLALNYGLRSANTGWDPAIANTFSLYQLGLDLGILHDRGVLSIFTFNNILGLALRLKKVTWATDFLEAYQQDLPLKGGSEVTALSRARLALANQEDGAALNHLQQADFKDFIHHLTARILQLKIYFRQNSYTLLHSHISSTRKLLTRRKGIGYHLQNYRNIFALANALLKLPPGDKKAVEQLRKRINTTEPCTEKPWLLSTLEDR